MNKKPSLGEILADSWGWDAERQTWGPRIFLKCLRHSRADLRPLPTLAFRLRWFHRTELRTSRNDAVASRCRGVRGGDGRKEAGRKASPPGVLQSLPSAAPAHRSGLLPLCLLSLYPHRRNNKPALSPFRDWFLYLRALGSQSRR